VQSRAQAAARFRPPRQTRFADTAACTARRFRRFWHPTARNLGNVEGKMEDMSDRVKFHTITTATKDYLHLAERLQKSGLLQGIDVEVIEVDEIHRSISPKGSIKSENYKAKIIFNKINETNLPVLWLDSDLVINGNLNLFNDLLQDGVEIALYNWLGDEDNAALKPVVYKNFMGSSAPSDRYFQHSHEICIKSTEQIICSGAVQLWANSYRSKMLLDEWGSLVQKHPRCQDDHLLDAAYNYSDEPPKMYNLTKAYCRYAFWPHVEPIINHPNFPYGDGDWDDTVTALKKERLKFSKTSPRPSGRFVPSGMVWDRLNSSLSTIEPTLGATFTKTAVDSLK
jgi:hypothetical protein